MSGNNQLFHTEAQSNACLYSLTLNKRTGNYLVFPSLYKFLALDQVSIGKHVASFLWGNNFMVGLLKTKGNVRESEETVCESSLNCHVFQTELVNYSLHWLSWTTNIFVLYEEMLQDESFFHNLRVHLQSYIGNCVKILFQVKYIN